MLSEGLGALHPSGRAVLTFAGAAMLGHALLRLAMACAWLVFVGSWRIASWLVGACMALAHYGAGRAADKLPRPRLRRARRAPPGPAYTLAALLEPYHR